MSLRRTIIIAILLALMIPTALVLLSGCESKPAAPDFNNPFDPDGPNGGDPFELVATLGDTTITLIWNNLDGYDLATYEVMHSNNYFGDFFSIGTVEASDLPIATFTYLDPDPTAYHYFLIQAYDTHGNFTQTSHIVPTSITTLARVVVGNGSGQVESRYINIRINVTSGDSLRISQSGHPDTEEVIAADDTGAPVTLPWDLGPVDSNDTTLTINVVVQNNTNLGDTNSVELDVNFTPTFGLSQGGASVAQIFPPLSIGTEGVASMRFADTEENLDTQPWMDAAPEYSGFELANTVNTQAINAEFLGDFGFSIFRQLNVQADLMTDATFSLILPSDHISDVSTIKGICNANATQMRFNESLDFTSTPWVAYEDTATIVLSSEPGEKTVYAQFRNEFADSPIFTDYVVHLLQSVEVAISAPSASDLVPGGHIFNVLGTATSPSATNPVTLVKFDGGDGFIDVEGTENWSVSWDVPRFDIDTNLTIRARAWAGDDSVTTTMDVIVTQLVVGISSPAAGDTLTSGADVEISGYAFAATGGAAVDSVVVEIDGESGLAVGTGPWAFDWVVASVPEETEMTINATVYAGSTQHTAHSSVLVVPDI